MTLQNTEKLKEKASDKRHGLLIVAKAGYALLEHKREKLKTYKKELQATLDELTVATSADNKERIMNCQKAVDTASDHISAATGDVKTIAELYQRDLECLREFDMEAGLQDDGGGVGEPKAYTRTSSSEWTPPKALPNDFNEYYMRALLIIGKFMGFERQSGNGPFSPSYTGDSSGKAEKRYFLDKLAPTFKTVMLLGMGASRVEIRDLDKPFDLGIEIDVYDKDENEPRMTFPVFFGEEAVSGTKRG
ncbi:hypothetical protein FBU59_000188 [Linderina macrospora]|uniref:Uncharacterized protein n=1 Tax=Linderina macrospora TaxID=4868 RepID=A0ACC1JHK1_9FUNG|nr:hypothetical protein FBU59_000188 [Linderina macrospora]